MMIQMGDKPNKTSIGQDRENLTFEALHRRNCRCATSHICGRHCLVAVAVAEARPPPGEFETDSGDDFSDREDKEIAPVIVSRPGRPIRAHFRLDL